MQERRKAIAARQTAQHSQAERFQPATDVAQNHLQGRHRARLGPTDAPSAGHRRWGDELGGQHRLLGQWRVLFPGGPQSHKSDYGHGQNGQDSTNHQIEIHLKAAHQAQALW